MTQRIDLRSDTITQPTHDMRRAMSEAPVGDEQRKEDPTVNKLVARIREKLHVEDAVFLPSATMANQIAFAVHGTGGDEIIGHRLSHPFHYETGGPAYLARMMIRPLEGERGMFGPHDLESAIRPAGDYGSQRSSIVLVENTTNIGGGTVWPLERVRAVTQMAREYDLKCHLDGSRLMNAAVASGHTAAEYAAHFDSITLCFSKGLGAPVGAVLAGSTRFIEEAWRFKHMFGGAMRQAGIIAAAALYGFEFHVERLAEDHGNAKALAEGIAGLPGILLDASLVETNIVVARMDPTLMTAAEFAGKMAEAGVDFFALGPDMFRLVTHLDVNRAMIDEAVKRFRFALT